MFAQIQRIIIFFLIGTCYAAASEHFHEISDGSDTPQYSEAELEAIYKSLTPDEKNLIDQLDAFQLRQSLIEDAIRRDKRPHYDKRTLESVYESLSLE